LVENDKIDTKRAIEVIESLKKTNAWLPVDELDRRLNMYQGMG
jgi:hypothetical protein